jgi:hypothetical protein
MKNNHRFHVMAHLCHPLVLKEIPPPSKLIVSVFHVHVFPALFLMQPHLYPFDWVLQSITQNLLVF